MLKEKKNCTFRYRSWKLTRQWSRARHSGVHGWRVHVNHVLLSLVLSTNFSQRFKVHGLVHNRCSIMLPWQALRGGGGRGFLHRKKSPYIELDPISKHYADKAYDVQNKSVVFSSPWAFHHLPPTSIEEGGKKKTVQDLIKKQACISMYILEICILTIQSNFPHTIWKLESALVFRVGLHNLAMGYFTYM